MDTKLKEINLHITDVCGSRCPMCYEHQEGIVKSHGNFDTLKHIVKNAIKNGHVESFVMVGGDPCTHPNLVELLRYVKEQGKEYGVNTRTTVLSNTHDYKENGNLVDIEYASQWIDEIDVTVHGATSNEHDKFNCVPGSYEHVMANINRFGKYKNENQDICAVINIMPYTVQHIKEIMQGTKQKLDNKLNRFMIQRIAPAGRAANTEKYFIEKQDINPLMQIFDTMIKNGNEIVFCDVFPWCSVKQEYRYMLPKGGCCWGYDTCAVFMDGSIKRCAMGSNVLSKRITDLDTPEAFMDWWLNDPELVKFRAKSHLDKVCKSCDLLQQCGGACALGRPGGDPYSKVPFIFNTPNDLKHSKIINPVLGHDYLATERNR